jgi:hypothetical protein
VAVIVLGSRTREVRSIQERTGTWWGWVRPLAHNVCGLNWTSGALILGA